MARLGRCGVGEELQNRIVQTQLALGDGQPDGGRGEALAQRIEHVGRCGVVRRPPALGHDVPVSHEHEAVQGVDIGIGGIDERQNGRRGDALCLRRAAGQFNPKAHGTGCRDYCDDAKSLHACVLTRSEVARLKCTMNHPDVTCLAAIHASTDASPAPPPDPAPQHTAEARIFREDLMRSVRRPGRAGRRRCGRIAGDRQTRGCQGGCQAYNLCHGSCGGAWMTGRWGQDRSRTGKRQ